MTGLLNRLGDRINPIVVKEARQAVNSRLVSGTLMLFLGIQLTAMLLLMNERPETGQLDPRAGREVFLFVQGILVVTCLLLIPAMSGIRLMVERSDVGADLMFITSLSPRAIVGGKLAAAAAVALLIFSACAPFMTFAYVLRGLDMPTIAIVLGADFLAVVYFTMLALFVASIPATRGFRIFLGIFAFIGLCYGTAGLLAGTTELLKHGIGLSAVKWEFWAAVAGVIALAIAATGQLMTWSVAMISPPAANRAFAVRIYTLAYWAIAGVACAAWSDWIDRVTPMIGWAMFGAAEFAVIFLMAASERDVLGPRVARRIPRRPLLRMLAFPFYSGAASGLLFGLLGGALTVAGLLLWHEWHPTMRLWPTSWWRPAEATGLILGYTYCYALTAILIRRLAHGTAFRPGYTWLVAVILIGLGSALPYIIASQVFDSRMRYGDWNGMQWLYLPSPFVMIESLESAGATSESPAIEFVLAWGAIVTLVNAGWLGRQARKFRPPKAMKAAVKIQETPA